MLIIPQWLLEASGGKPVTLCQPTVSTSVPPDSFLPPPENISSYPLSTPKPCPAQGFCLLSCLSPSGLSSNHTPSESVHHPTSSDLIAHCQGRPLATFRPLFTMACMSIFLLLRFYVSWFLFILNAKEELTQRVYEQINH